MKTLFCALFLACAIPAQDVMPTPVQQPLGADDAFQILEETDCVAFTWGAIPKVNGLRLGGRFWCYSEHADWIMACGIAFQVQGPFNIPGLYLVNPATAVIPGPEITPFGDGSGIVLHEWNLTVPLTSAQIGLLFWSQVALYDGIAVRYAQAGQWLVVPL